MSTYKATTNAEGETIFVPESGLNVQVDRSGLQSSSQFTPKRTGPVQTPAAITQADKTREEFNALASAGGTSSHPIRKHEQFFHELFTWKHPRASGLIMASSLGSILFSQFVNIPKFALRGMWIAMLASTVIELLGRHVLGAKDGFIKQFAPHPYYTVSRQSLQNTFDEVTHLTNFVATEMQRLFFAEEPVHTGIAFVAAFIAYQLVKILPLWMLTFIGISVSFAVPPVYIRNKHVIDKNLEQFNRKTRQQYQHTVHAVSDNAQVLAEKAKIATVDLGNKAGVDMHKYVNTPAGANVAPVNAQGGINAPVIAAKNISNDIAASTNQAASNIKNQVDQTLNAPSTSTSNVGMSTGTSFANTAPLDPQARATVQASTFSTGVAHDLSSSRMPPAAASSFSSSFAPLDPQARVSAQASTFSTGVAHDLSSSSMKPASSLSSSFAPFDPQARATVQASTFSTGVAHDLSSSSMPPVSSTFRDVTSSSTGIPVAAPAAGSNNPFANTGSAPGTGLAPLVPGGTSNLTSAHPVAVTSSFTSTNVVPAVHPGTHDGGAGARSVLNAAQETMVGQEHRSY